WMHARLPHDAPRIAFSLDDTWLNELGITDSTYQQALTRVGGRLIRFEPDAAGSPEVDAEALEALLDREQIDGVLLTGGGDVDPELYGGNPNGSMMINRLRDDFEIALIRAAKARGIPVLGICRGCQILNVAFGGTLRNLRADEELKKAHFTFAGHPVELAQGSRLAEVTGDIRLDNVHSFHGQAVDKPGAGVSIVATGPGGIVEAIEVEPDDDDCWIVGVQWHPEMAVNDAIQNRLFRAFVRRAAACRR
ncbi:MAG TPA: gamma-glutamyl-gamma-aminobutyrate hydrolase family protein, partial [Candidatus Hydrogenedentes bacterium]|nr:gamma-glutamyl-gamma-aminobutyrate hydrolase family protein [Candidatus Hydrogenedentota bacterium]